MISRNAKAIEINLYGEDWRLYLELGEYANNGRRFVGIDCESKDVEGFEPFSDLTVNIPMYYFEEDDEIIVDTNNNDEDLIDKLIDMEIIEDTGKFAQSGYCSYMVAKFNYNKAKDYIIFEK